MEKVTSKQFENQLLAMCDIRSNLTFERCEKIILLSHWLEFPSYSTRKRIIKKLKQNI